MLKPTIYCPALALLLAVSTIADGQQLRRSADRWLDNCRDSRGWGDRSERFCEVRDFTVAAVKSLVVDGRTNGGVTVHGWDQSNIQVLAMIQTQADDEDEARALAKDVAVSTSNGKIQAEGPSTRRRQSWSVSYEIWVPRHTDLELSAHNGGLSVDGVDARMDMETTNGGVHLAGVDGDVRATTSNGGVTVELDGDRWRGTGLDARTTNGGVHLIVPKSYSARLETGTVNGRMNIDFPITVQGMIGRRITTQLGNGGSPIRVMTTNGGVSISTR
jgi:DUF4097 and DUF4098 domain-containing protein YvlB